jgi:hypothetical protein
MILQGSKMLSPVSLYTFKSDEDLQKYRCTKLTKNGVVVEFLADVEFHHPYNLVNVIGKQPSCWLFLSYTFEKLINS